MSGHIIVGHCIDVLRELPAESVQCCVTSPPYWGLRDYGLPPTVWGGDDGCEHEWGDGARTIKRQEQRDHNGRDFGETRGHEQSRVGMSMEVSQGCYCQLCGAWRGELGLEPTPELYVEHLVAVMREVRRVLRGDGVTFLNLGDTFADKQLVGIPWRVAFALQADGWWLRSDIIWAKGNPMPESVTDRPTKSHEYVFLLSKNSRYYYDAEAIAETASKSGMARLESPTPARFGGTDKHTGYGTRIASGNEYVANPTGTRNARSVWQINTTPYKGAHFATMPVKLAERCILAGTSAKGCCPKCGAPWERVVEREKIGGEYRVGAKAEGNYDGRGTASSTLGSTLPHSERAPKVTTLGWRPTCDCDAGEPIPCTVLDPFGGAGTTALAAAQNGREYVIIELKDDGLARERLQGVAVKLEMTL